MNRTFGTGKRYRPSRQRRLRLSPEELKQKSMALPRAWSMWKIGDEFKPCKKYSQEAYGIGKLCKITKITSEKIYFEEIK